MALFGHNNTEQTRFTIPNATPVDVVASFNKKGEFIPLYVQVMEEEERISKKIETIKRTNDKHAVIEFTCTVKVTTNTTQQILLIYSIQEKKWFLKH